MTLIDNIKELFKTKANEKVLSKGDYLIREGEIEKNLYYIQQGAVKVFYLNEYDEHIIRLGYDSSILNSLSSFIKEQPSELYIEAIKKTTVLVLSKQEFYNYVNHNEESLNNYISFLENLITQQIDRELDLLVSSPVERLNRVIKRSPHLFQHIPLKYIASYLRMTPETVSRIRNS
jgi:CRP-like cAMP-binding protein